MTTFLQLSVVTSIQTLEDAVRPAHFHAVIQAVKQVSGFDEQMHSYQTPCRALNLGHSLQKISDILHCRALIAEDPELIKSTQTFITVCTTKWSELTALTTLNEAHFNKPSTLLFTEDVQRLHQHLEKTANLVSEKDPNSTSLCWTLQSNSGKNNPIQPKTWRSCKKWN